MVDSCEMGLGGQMYRNALDIGIRGVLFGVLSCGGAVVGVNAG